MKYKYTISGVDCPNCAAKLAELMSANDGITLAKINFLTERLTVESELAEEELDMAPVLVAKCRVMDSTMFASIPRPTIPIMTKK